MLAELALGGVVQPVDGYAQGVRSRWFWGDFDVLLAVLFRSRAITVQCSRSRTMVAPAARIASRC
jgi:hypothetical protein